MDKNKYVAQAEIRASDVGTRPMIRCEIFYGQEAENLPHREVLVPGCFSKSIRDAAAGKGNVMALWSHEAGQPLGSARSGTLELNDSASSLVVSIFPDLEQSWGKDAYLACKRGDVTGCSFGFIPRLDKINDDGIRELVDLELLEVSPCVFPAYPSTNVSARNNKQNNNIRGKKMKTENIYTRENLGIIFDRLEAAEPQSREYFTAAEQYDRVASVLYPGAPRVAGPDAISFEGLRAWGKLPTGDEPAPMDVFDGYGGETRDETRGETSYAKRTNTKKYDTIYLRYLVDGPAGINAGEYRTLQTDSDTAGGYIVAPQQMANKLVKGLDEQVFFRSLATKYNVPNAVSLGIPVLDNDPADSDWTSELGTGSEDSTMSFGKRELNPHPLAKRIKVANKLLRASTLNAGDIVQQRLLYKFAVTEEKAFLTGHGNNQPLGVFVASDNGISTSRDVSTGNTTTSITTDGLIEAYHGLSPA